MKMYLSAFLLLSSLLLTGCGKEEFGTAAQDQKTETNPLQVLEQRSCANLTLVNPEVDILYVVDNSTSSFYVPSDIKTGISNTISSVSDDFDYRVIGTPLLQTSGGNGDFQVLAKNPSTLSASFNSKKVNSANDFSFFSQSSSVAGSNEPGLARVRDFLTAHSTDGLFRQNAYLFIILVSNGRDTDVERGQNYNPQETFLVPNSTNGTIYGDRLNSLKQIKLSLNSKQFRLFSVTASAGTNSCPSGYMTSNKSYVQMSKDLYEHHQPQLTDQKSGLPDHYNLCGGSVSGLFTSVNASIKKIIIPHTYRYWPITFTASTGVDQNKIKVFRSSPTEPAVEMPRNVAWVAEANPGSLNTRILPTEGEPTTVPNVIKFMPNHEIVYPECVSVVSESNLEYFKYVVSSKQPQPGTIVVKVNGRQIPASAIQYAGYQFEKNIKVAHNGYLATPEQKRTGYFIEITAPAEYYKSGDNVEVSFIPAAI